MKLEIRAAIETCGRMNNRGILAAWCSSGANPAAHPRRDGRIVRTPQY
jgi:hypothetical protein